jgi:hypothetical protein
MIQPSLEPWKTFVETLRKLLKLIAAWDSDYDATEKFIKKPRDFPVGAAKKRKHYANYFSGYPNPKKNKTSKVYLEVRFLAPKPDKLYPSTSKRWVKNYQIAFLKRSQTSSSPRTHMHAKRYAPNILAGSLGPPSPSTVKNWYQPSGRS